MPYPGGGLLDFSFLLSLGVAGALVVVDYLLSVDHRLMTANRSDRAEYPAALAARETAHAAELAAAHAGGSTLGVRCRRVGGGRSRGGRVRVGRRR